MLNGYIFVRVFKFCTFSNAFVFLIVLTMTFNKTLCKHLNKNNNYNFATVGKNYVKKTQNYK